MTIQNTSRVRTLRRNETDAEYRLWYELANRRLNGYKFVRQFPIDRFVVDFACRAKRLVVELDGAQHAGSKTDPARTDTLNRAGWSVLRFWNGEVLREKNAVCETILTVLEGRIVEPCDGAGLLHGLRFHPAVNLRDLPGPVDGSELPGRDVSRPSRPSPSSPAGPSPRGGEEPFADRSMQREDAAKAGAVPLSLGERVAAQRPGEGAGRDGGRRMRAASGQTPSTEPHP